MSDEPKPYWAKKPKQLRGWKAIASYMDCSTSTAYRYAKHHQLPVIWGSGIQVRSFDTEIDAWLKKGLKPETRVEL